jgi:hypothetical protein
MAEGVLAVWTDIAPELEADFNEWYWREHLPERLAVPGFRRGRRFRALSGAPRYFACYDLEAPAVLESAAYLERLNHPTEWTKRVMKGFRNTTRASFARALTVGRISGAVWLTVRLAPRGEQSAALEAHLKDGLLPALQACPGITRAQYWREHKVAAPATLEAALRGNADEGAGGALVVEAMTAEALAAADHGVIAASPLARWLKAPPVAATYTLLCSL